MDNDTMVAVTQEDREAAAAYIARYLNSPPIFSDQVSEIRRGERDWDALVQTLARHRHQFGRTGAGEALREALTKAIETLAASRHLIGKYCPDHHWLPEHDQRISDLRAALSQSTAGEDGDALRQQGQREGKAAVCQWLRGRGAMRPPAVLHHAAGILADQFEQSEMPGENQ